jgi:hypothetical protein
LMLINNFGERADETTKSAFFPRAGGIKKACGADRNGLVVVTDIVIITGASTGGPTRSDVGKHRPYRGIRK